MLKATSVGVIRPRILTLPNGNKFEYKQGEWSNCVVNLKEFDANNTEILRVSIHNSGLLTHVYAMRSFKGKIVKELNDLVVGVDYANAVQSAINEVGLAKIKG